MNIDGRTLPHGTSELIRRWAVRRVKAGERPSSVMKSYGLCRTTIYRWLRAVKRGGEKALRARKHMGPKGKLTPAQKLKVRHWINGKDPRQYGFDFGLWTRQIISALIAERFGVKLGVTAVGRLLAELDITPQKPLPRAYERATRWRSSVGSGRSFRSCGREPSATGRRFSFSMKRGYVRTRFWGAPGGCGARPPEVATSGKRQSVSAISAVNALGEFWFEIYTERLNAAKFIELLKHFMRRRKYPVFLVLDRHPAHVAKVVAQYVQSLKGRLELHFLPGYAPELNPDEFVWNHLKRQGVSKKPLRQNESLRERVQADLAHVKSRPALVRSFFHAPSVAYTTD